MNMADRHLSSEPDRPPPLAHQAGAGDHRRRSSCCSSSPPASISPAPPSRTSCAPRSSPSLNRSPAARVEIKSLHWNLSKLDIEIDDLTIHGLEAPGEVPYAHVDHISIHAKIISLFKKEIGLRYLALTRPVLHLITYPDGSTNQPTPKTKSTSSTDPVQEVFDLAVDQAVLSKGTLILNDRKLPFDVAANQLVANMTFSPNADPNLRQYNTSIKIGELSADYKGSRPILSNLETQLALRPNAADIKVLRWSSARSRFEASGTLVELPGSADRARLPRRLRRPRSRQPPQDPRPARRHPRPQRQSYVSRERLLLFRQHRYPQPHLSRQIHQLDRPVRELPLLRSIPAASPSTASTPRSSAEMSAATSKSPTGPMRKSSAAARRSPSPASPSNAPSLPSPPRPCFEKIRIDSAASGTINASWVGSPANADAVVALNLAPGGHPGTLRPAPHRRRQRHLQRTRQLARPLPTQPAHPRHAAHRSGLARARQPRQRQPAIHRRHPGPQRVHPRPRRLQRAEASV